LGFFSKHYSVLLIILGPCILFVPMLVKGEALFWGTPLLQFVPWRQFALDVLSDGFVPLWNPLLGLGTPLIANYQSALFYPPNGILFIVGPAWGHGLLVMLHIIWAGLGMRILCRELDLGVFAQTVAALSFSLSGYMIARAGFLSINATAAWLPWIIFMAERIVKEHAGARISRDNIRSIFLLGILFAFSWLGGHAQTSWYTLVLTVTWVLWRGYYHQKASGILRAGLAFILSGIAGFLLSAIQLLPVLEYLLHSHRASDIDPEFALNYSFWPWRLLGLVAPNLFGNPAAGNYWGYANYWEDAVYIGIFPLILAVLYLLRTIWKREGGGLARFLSMVGLVSLLFALGKNTPIYTFLFENIPTFDLFQAPTRWSILLVFSLALLAGLGVDEWEKGELIKLFWVRLGTVGAITITLVALGSSFLLPDLEESFIPSIAIFGIWLSLIGIVAWRRRIKPSIVWPILVVILVAADLTWAGSGLNPTVEMELYQDEGLLLNKVSGQHRLYMNSDLEELLKFEETHRFDTFNSDLDWSIVRKVGIPNTPMLDNVSSINNFDPILSNWYVEWLEGIETLSGALKTKWLRAVDVGWIARLDSTEIESMTYQGLPDPRRAHLVDDVIWVEDTEESYEIVFSNRFDPFTTVVLEYEGDKVQRGWGSDGQITLLDQPNPNIVQVVISTPSDTILVLSDLWYPGWKGYLDGVETEVYRANYLLRAVVVPPGSHTVEFKYRPLSFTIGAVLSAIMLLSMGFVLWKIRRS
jgi:uncharacterized membrane protein YfhO